jgi:hypothetical protein
MRLQSELFDRAADCERLRNLTSDHYKKLTLRLMRDLWIALANESVGMSERVLLNEIAGLDKIQSGPDPSVDDVVTAGRLAHSEALEASESDEWSGDKRGSPSRSPQMRSR